MHQATLLPRSTQLEIVDLLLGSRLPVLALFGLVLTGCSDAPITLSDGGALADGSAPHTSDAGEMDGSPFDREGGAVWSDCGDAAVFGAEGEACAFSGSCAECERVSPARQVACVASALRFAGVGPGSCLPSSADGGTGDGGNADGGMDCTSQIVPYPAGGACSMATATCWRSSGSFDCITAEPACRRCVANELAACATHLGCDDELAAVNCCLATNCPSDRSCFDTTCRREAEAYSSCGNGTTCRPTGLCFPDEGACAPVRWRAPVASCSAATRACLDAATTQTAFDACLAADGMSASCESCLRDELFHCATDPAASFTCGDELGLLDCCVQAACPSGTSSPTCWYDAQSDGGACSAQSSAFASCITIPIDAGTCVRGSACFLAP